MMSANVSAGAPKVEGDMPELAGATGWLNSKPLTRASLRGKVVVLDFWTYSCINCLRALPYVNAWYQHYKDSGLVIIGVHSPEFEFEKDTRNVRKAVEKFAIQYPVALDSNMARVEGVQQPLLAGALLRRRAGPDPRPSFRRGQVRALGTHHSPIAHRGRREESSRSARRCRRAGRLRGRRYRQRGLTRNLPRLRARREFPVAGFVRARQRQELRAAREASRSTNGRSAAAGRSASEKSVLDAPPGRIVFRFRARDLHLVLGPGERSRQAGALPRDCSTASRRAPITAWTSTTPAMARCASSACTS